MAIVERIMTRVVRTASGCWVCQLKPNYSGYIRIKDGDRLVRAHRVIYEHHKGPVPAGLELDHLCRVRACCNPDHLEAVTHAENMRRGVRSAAVVEAFIAAGRARAKAQKFCVHGHAYTPENTGYHHGGRRFCRTCNRNEAREYQRRKRAERTAHV